jgi:hypothetical protein
MYTFEEQKPHKRYRKVKRGWHIGKIYQASLNNTRSGQLRQYIKVDFEIMREKECKDSLVPGFFNYNKNRNPDPRFLEMGKAAGLRGDYGNDINPVFRDLIGKELMIYIVHRYKRKQRRDRVEDFRPLTGSY